MTAQTLFSDMGDRLRSDGYVQIKNHLDPDRVQAAQSEAIRLLECSELNTGRHPNGWDEITHAGDHSEVLREVLFDPLVSGLAMTVLGPDVELASGGEVDRKAARSDSSSCSWHADFTWMPYVKRPRPFCWVTAYFFLSDITHSCGPLWVIPGSHRWAAEPNHSLLAYCERGGTVPSARPMVGAAGTLLVFNNEIWHMSTANESNDDRLVYRTQLKPAWMKAWGHGQPSRGLVDTAATPLERQLLGVAQYDEVPWQYGDDFSTARFPAVRELAQRGIDIEPSLAQIRQPSEPVETLIADWSGIAG